MSTRNDAGSRLTAWQLASDIGLATIIAALGLVEVWAPLESVEGDGSPAVSSIGIVLSSIALSQRRSQPIAVFGVFATWIAIGVLTLGNIQILFFGQLVPILIAIYSGARHGPGRIPWFTAGAGALTLLAADAFMAELQEWSEMLFHWGMCTLAFLIGWGLRRSEERAVAAAIEAREVTQASEIRAAEAVRSERTRIARELHDVLAHSVSVMVVQARAAEQVMDANPALAKRSLGAIRDTGNQSLEEVRRLVTLLRDERTITREPQPGIHAIPALVQSVRDAGLNVTLTMQGDLDAIAPGPELAVYRIVQEALTNVRRHSNAKNVDVTVEATPTGVHIDVVDDGESTAGRSGGDHASGHGLVGIRERVAMYNGTVHALGAEDGFRVRVTLNWGGEQ